MNSFFKNYWSNSTNKSFIKIIWCTILYGVNMDSIVNILSSTTSNSEQWRTNAYSRFIRVFWPILAWVYTLSGLTRVRIPIRARTVWWSTTNFSTQWMPRLTRRLRSTNDQCSQKAALLSRTHQGTQFLVSCHPVSQSTLMYVIQLVWGLLIYQYSTLYTRIMWVHTVVLVHWYEIKDLFFLVNSGFTPRQLILIFVLNPSSDSILI